METAPRGRGAALNPTNRFETIAIERDPEIAGPERIDTEVLRDTSRSLIAYNDSPDVGFDASINPYRGCEHGCIYCYARPFHEYLGFSAGLDFETRILVKEDAPALLRKELSAPKWKPQTLALSGVTDPYQPLERKLEVTRRCLEVLAELAKYDAAMVGFSITSLDPEVTRRMEPRTSHPRERLEAMAEVSSRGVPCVVLVSPVVPGLTDHEMPGILA
ncbi:MAG TPA: radical SAM protein, partial [Gemmatimonadales bacterium]|nr:radical SAM protein [Gemmatimonadales bacterium]